MFLLLVFGILLVYLLDNNKKKIIYLLHNCSSIGQYIRTHIYIYLQRVTEEDHIKQEIKEYLKQEKKKK